MSFHRNGEEFLDVEDAKKVTKPSFKGSVARPPKGSDPKIVGELKQQKAPVTAENEQSVGEAKIAKGKKGSKSTKKAAVESQNMKKQIQEKNRPAPHAVKGKGREAN